MKRMSCLVHRQSSPVHRQSFAKQRQTCLFVPTVLSSGPSVLCNATHVMSSAPQVLSSAPPVLCNATHVPSSGPPVLSAAPPVLCNAAPVLCKGVCFLDFLNHRKLKFLTSNHQKMAPVIKKTLIIHNVTFNNYFCWHVEPCINL